MSDKLTLSRRSFAKVIGAGAAITALPPMAFIANGQTTSTEGPARLHFNENPFGPSPAARRALERVSDVAWQYPGAMRDALIAALAKLHGVESDHILPGNGSSEILHTAGTSLVTPARGVLVADPTYEALEQYAASVGAPTTKIPLTRAWAHDTAAMLASKRTHGVIYICNPNNPTASITPKAAVHEVIVRAPADSVVIVDEAYAEYVASPDYESVVPMVSRHPNLLVLRTFSKIHGLAGLRIGYAIAQPALLGRLRARQARNTLNAAALSAALASLEDRKWLEESRGRNATVRDHAIAELARMEFTTIPTHANFFMVDVRREIRPLADAMRAGGVAVGRPFPPLTTHLRVTVGTEPQMEKFLGLFRDIVS